MEMLIELAGTAIALLTVFILYVGGTAIGLLVLERLFRAMHSRGQDPHLPSSTS